ncbi:MAG: hypothetical protein ACKOAD_03345 [Gammaproteobacteria bacterium]
MNTKENIEHSKAILKNHAEHLGNSLLKLKELAIGEALESELDNLKKFALKPFEQEIKNFSKFLKQEFKKLEKSELSRKKSTDKAELEKKDLSEIQALLETAQKELDDFSAQAEMFKKNMAEFEEKLKMNQTQLDYEHLPKELEQALSLQAKINKLCAEAQKTLEATPAEILGKAEATSGQIAHLSLSAFERSKQNSKAIEDLRAVFEKKQSPKPTGL